MITLNQKQKIIIAYHNRQKSQRAIARELGLNRRTVASEPPPLYWTTR